MYELYEVMRQRGDNVFIDLLNNVRIGGPSDSDLHLLQSRVILTSDDNYPVNALHVFKENEPARQHNSFMLQTIDSNLITIKAIDQIPKGVPNYIYDKILNSSPSQTKGLLFKISIKIGARVMLTTNIDVSDKLINGQIGAVSYIMFENNKVKNSC